MEAYAHLYKTLVRLSGLFVLLLIAAYGVYAVMELRELDAALSEARAADPAYPYATVMRALYRGALTCEAGGDLDKAREYVKERLWLATHSASWPYLYPESRARLLELERALPHLRRCADWARYADASFDVYVDALKLSQDLRAEIHVLLKKQRRDLYIGLAILLLLAGTWVWNQERIFRMQRAHIRNLEGESRFKTRLLGLVAHELKTPLAAVVGFAELARRDPKHLSQLEAASERLERSLTAFLDLYRLEEGQRLQLEPQPLDLAALTKEALALAKAAYQMTRFELEAEEPVPVLADRERLLHAILNLLENAAKYGGCPVRLRLFARGPWARLEVDTPAALDPESAEALFAPLARLPEHQKKAGWGLGLSLVRELAEAHGGRAGYERRGEAGVFFIELPLNPASFGPDPR